ncbi:Uncharacterized protein OS=uncultured bacterium PE=4 SV=1 [Gemmata massiliana]|uniref:SMI1/KNR4 family protein n=1 Tax=Gemmata massiliana TaxID=1210884 RepID=A0A6P2CWZ6_9BACT|nr:hypothetical protein [Gemmata massiliana]VTR93107.1 Uncharacterized protein OS=uncultured bacterium PE=4 SV=1 [Gemmata massiliana]
MFGWLFRRTLTEAEAVASASRFLVGNEYRVVRTESDESGDAIPVLFERASLSGERWCVSFRRVFPPGVLSSRSNVEIWVHAETGKAEFPHYDRYVKPRELPRSEIEWQACTDPATLLEVFEEKASDRKFRLFACGACRHHPAIRHDLPLQGAIQSMEHLADGVIQEAERPWYNDFQHHSLICRLGGPSGVSAAFETIGYLSGCPLSDLCRCVFGNPFRPVTGDPSWLTSTVLSLASQMYASRDFSPMPILADALQDAGCGSDDILTHCRGAGPHVRGCWVVDLILGKS